MKKFLRDTSLIFRIIFRSTLGQKEKEGKKKIAPKIGISLLGLVFVLVVAFMTVSMTLTAAPYDNGNVVSALIGFSQVIVLIFGFAAAVDFLFFSKDTTLLTTLPVSPTAIFLAKTAMVYLTELGLSAVISLPSLITYGILKSVLVGFQSVGVGYFIYSILSTFLIPLIPLLIIGVFSMPVMYLLSFIKKSEFANVIFSIIASLALVGFSVGMQFALNPGLGGSADNAVSMMSFFDGFDKAFIFNYPLKMALNAKSAVSIAWFIAYIGVVLAAGAIAVLFANFSYKRVLSKGVESGSGSSRKKRKTETSYKSYSFTKTFLLKEIRVFFKTPTLLIGFLMSFIMFPLMGVIMGISFGQASGEIPAEEIAMFDAISSQMSMTLMLYIGFMLTCTTNMAASVGFSMEGKNFRVLKTLPISGRAVVKLKLMLAFVQTAVSSFLAAVGMLIAMLLSKSDAVSVAVATVSVFVVSFIGGCGYDMMALSNDMHKLNINWQNIKQITKNNPAFTGLTFRVMGCGLLFMIVGMIIPIFTELPTVVMICITVGIALVVALSFAVFGYLKLDKDPDKWFAEVEA